MSFENLISQYSDTPAYVNNIEMAFIARPHKEWRFKRLRPKLRQLIPLYSYPCMFNEQLYAFAMSTKNVL